MNETEMIDIDGRRKYYVVPKKGTHSLDLVTKITMLDLPMVKGCGREWGDTELSKRHTHTHTFERQGHENRDRSTQKQWERVKLWDFEKSQR